MRIIRRMAAARHCVALWVLAVVMSIFASTGGRAKASAAEGQVLGDPVTSTMTWEGAATDHTDDSSSRVPDENCYTNCPYHCNDGCPPTPEPEPVG